jgi:hypothetical protein
MANINGVQPLDVVLLDFIHVAVES